MCQLAPGGRVQSSEAMTTAKKTETNNKEKSGDAGNVRAVERALDILVAVSAQDTELTASEILRRVDLSRPTLYRLLYTLEQRGFVASNGEPQRFSIGPAVARMAWAWTASLDIARVAQPVLQRVWETTGETVALFVPRGNMRMCVAELQSPQPLSFRRGVGYSERAALGASGRALLAWSDPSPEQLAVLCEGLELEPMQLKKELAQVRKQGFATSRNELIKGAGGVAVPFFESSGRVAGSMGIFGPDVRMDKARIDELAQLLLREAGQLSGLLGHGRSASAASDGASGG